jgi:hypothetical protein
VQYKNFYEQDEYYFVQSNTLHIMFKNTLCSIKNFVDQKSDDLLFFCAMLVDYFILFYQKFDIL